MGGSHGSDIDVDGWVKHTGRCQVPGCGKETRETGGIYSKDGRRWASCLECYIRISQDPDYPSRVSPRQVAAR